MHLINNKPSGLKESETTIIQVKVWEAFLLHSRHNLYATLSTYSLDNGPLVKGEDDLSTVTFRFMLRDWNKTLRDLLDQHNIPVIKENRISLKEDAVWHSK
jgi:hypothetical protein